MDCNKKKEKKNYEKYEKSKREIIKELKMKCIGVERRNRKLINNFKILYYEQLHILYAMG